MFKRKLKLNKDKTNTIIVGNPLQMKNIDLPLNLKLNQTDTNLSTKLRNLGVVLDENLTLKDQVVAVKKNILEVLYILQKYRRLSTESLS